MNTVPVPKTQSGFTLIELIIILVLVTLLTISALPKLSRLPMFSFLFNEEQKEKNQLLANNLQDAMNVVHGLWIVQNRPKTITLSDGTIVHMNEEGWPDSMETISETNHQSCAALWNNLLTNATEAKPGEQGCGKTKACFNATHTKTLTSSTCTYTPSESRDHGVLYIITGEKAGTVSTF